MRLLEMILAICVVSIESKFDCSIIYEFQIHHSNQSSYFAFIHCAFSLCQYIFNYSNIILTLNLAWNKFQQNHILLDTWYYHLQLKLTKKLDFVNDINIKSAF